MFLSVCFLSHSIDSDICLRAINCRNGKHLPFPTLTGDFEGGRGGDGAFLHGITFYEDDGGSVSRQSERSQLWSRRRSHNWKISGTFVMARGPYDSATQVLIEVSVGRKRTLKCFVMHHCKANGVTLGRKRRFSRTFEKIIGSSAVRFPIHAIAGL